VTVAKQQVHRGESSGASALSVGRSSPLGAMVVEGGVNFSLFTRHATGVELLFFDREDDATPSRTVPIGPATNRTYHYWHVFVPRVAPGQLYGYRVLGPSDPPRGQQFDSTKVLLDPYARGVVVPKNYDRKAGKYGRDFAPHIEKLNPTFCKVLVRFNPEGDRELNRRQAGRLKQLSDHLHAANRLYMFELLVPTLPEQLQRLGGDKKAYDVQLRPALMVQAIHELQDAGIEADVWKIEGIEPKEDCQKVVDAARRAGRSKVGCVVLGRGEDDAREAVPRGHGTDAETRV
jgi:hypothetical protein